MPSEPVKVKSRPWPLKRPSVPRPNAKLDLAPPKPLSPTPAASAQPKISAATAVQPFAIIATLSFLFLRFSFLHDFIASHIGFNTYLLTLTGLLAYFALLRSSVWRAASRSKLFWAWVGFTTLLAIGVPFSSWPGGSVSIVEPFIKDNFICLPLIAGVFGSWERLRRLFLTIAWAGVVVVALTMIAGRSDLNGRLNLFFTTTIGNSNDLATHLIFVTIFMLIAAFSLQRNMLVRLLFIASSLVALYEIFRTASRGAFLALLVSAVIAFFTGNMKSRFSVLFLAPIVGLAIITMMPESTVTRLLTFSGQGSEEARESYEGRRMLLQRSIDITLEHPILGVGAGQFSSYEGGESDAQGHHHSHWMETHNSFTEISSEDGIPALLCAIWGLAGSLLLFWRLSRNAKKNPALQRFAVAGYV
ncbi:MAG: O-antigen ligase family protein, partial [Acidobacteriaceae bacterium]|nr:O-antigen ligase family protein [Acidobacteriaceae bacterium]